MLSTKRNKSTCIIRPLLFIVVFLTLIFAGGKISGASPFTDDFDDYIFGDLNAQSDWVECQSYQSWQVATSTFYSEPNSAFIRQSVWGSCSERTGNDVETGGVSFWGKISGGYGSNSRVYLWGTTTEAILSFNTGGSIDYYNGSSWVNVCNVVDDVWFWSMIEWDSTTNKVKYTCESVDQTSGWVDPVYDQTINYISKVWLVSTGNNPNTYFDDFGSMSLCSYYGEYNACINAGCQWYYSIYLQDYFCVAPLEPDEDECGAFYKCQYCGNQTSCENQVNCQWIDRGFGEQCYMFEPTIPPVDVEWEMPELDECNGLSGTELWLCEIKNFIAGIFMPSQEKIEVLYQTIGAFKQKFPFNYIESLNEFFGSIVESLDEEKSIPIKILGNESNVDFTFWNSTTTIGGEVETFKNAWFDFTTIIVLIGWFVWLISWIKRFF